MLLTLAFAQPLTVDATTRFDDRRWLARTSVHTPSAVQLGTPDENVRTHTWELELRCTLKTPERARCSFEQVALRAHQQEPTAEALGVVTEHAGSLMGQTLEFDVNREGRVWNHQLPHLDPSDAWEAGTSTLLQPIVQALDLSGSTLRTPGERGRSSQWTSHEDAVLGIVSPFQGDGGVNEVLNMLQDVGGIRLHHTESQSSTILRTSERSEDDHETPGRESHFVLKSTTDSMLEPVQGYPIERRWRVWTDSSSNGSQYSSTGLVRALRRDETVEVGPTHLLALWDEEPRPPALHSTKNHLPATDGVFETPHTYPRCVELEFVDDRAQIGSLPRKNIKMELQWRNNRAVLGIEPIDWKRRRTHHLDTEIRAHLSDGEEQILPVLLETPYVHGTCVGCSIPEVVHNRFELDPKILDLLASTPVNSLDVHLKKLARWDLTPEMSARLQVGAACLAARHWTP